MQENCSDSLDFGQNKAQHQGEIVNVEFLISEISEKYYHSMKTILEKLAGFTHILSSEWADTIIAHKDLGNLVDVEEDEND